MTETRWRIPLSDVIVDDELVEAVLEVVRSGWWSMGPRVEEFEHEFAAFSGAAHAIAVANGTAALHLALLAVGLRPGRRGDPAVAELRRRGEHDRAHRRRAGLLRHRRPDRPEPRPRPTSRPRDRPRDARRSSPSTTAGYPVRHDAIAELAERHGLALVEDAAHAPGAVCRAAACGTLGDVGCFSFFANKNLPIGEGGMVVTDDAELAERMRLLRSHGMTTLTWDRHRGHASSYDVVCRASTTAWTRFARGDRARPARAAGRRERRAAAGSRRATGARWTARRA